MPITPNNTEQQRVTPSIIIKGLSTEAYEHILVEKAKLDARNHRTLHVGEAAAIVFNKLVEGKK